MKTIFMSTLTALALVSAGCNEGGPPVAAPPAAAPVTGGPPTLTPPPAAPVQVTASEDHTKKGIAGNEMGKGILATPARVYLRIPDRVLFLNLENTMKLYKGEHGALPKTHEDFMRDIVEAYSIKLPELPDDSHYIYVPDKEELMIERQPM
jgi:hypothetical protein